MPDRKKNIFNFYEIFLLTTKKILLGSTQLFAQQAQEILPLGVKIIEA
jgi:hypothetical protein